MFTSDDLLSGELPDAKVGIGCGSDLGNVQRSAERFGQSVTVYRDPEKLVDDLVSGRIDAAVRGDMSSSVLLPILKKGLGLDELERVVIIEPISKGLLFVAPVGIDEGWSVAQKHDLAVRSASLMARLGMTVRIAVMSGGRKGDIGRHPTVDRTIADAEELVRTLNGEGFDAYNAEILIESAAKEANLIIAPDGISGNLIFRTLHFMGGAQALGAPVINTKKVFIDTSRVKTDYTDSIALAMKLTRE